MMVALFILVVLMVMMIFYIVGGVLSMETSQDVVNVVASLGDDGDVIMSFSSLIHVIS